MSRSYRKPYTVDGYGSRWKRYIKNCFNRKIRRKSVDYEIADGGSYRKMNQPWDLCDYRFRYNPHPKVYWWRGVQEIIEPDPIYKYNRK